jgi:hypothetical protein
VKRKKAKWGYKATERWYINYSINPRLGTNRYTAGNIIIILGEPFIIYLECRKFRVGALENGNPLFICQVCRRFTRAIEERTKANRARHKRARVRAKQAERRARRRKV